MMAFTLVVSCGSGRFGRAGQGHEMKIALSVVTGLALGQFQETDLDASVTFTGSR
jgi:hypothetical protein